MDLPSELYTLLYVLADDIETTKALRLVSKRALTASYWYFKILLTMPVHMKYTGPWTLITPACLKCDTELQKEIKAADLLHQSRGRTLVDYGYEFDEIMMFRMTTKDLLHTLL